MSESTPRQRARRWSAAEAHQALAAYHQSGLSQRAFCAERGISLSRLRYWLRRPEGEETTQPGPGLGSLVAVAVKTERGPAPRSVPPIELEVEGGYLLRIAPGFDPASLRAIISVLRGAERC